jgi:hypothetical protein
MAHPRSLETGVCSELIHPRSSPSPYGLRSSHAKVTLCFLAGFQPSEFGKTYTATSISGYSCHIDHFRGLNFSLLHKPLYWGMFFGCTREDATREAQFEFHVKLFILTHKMCEPRVLLLQNIQADFCCQCQC